MGAEVERHFGRMHAVIHEIIEDAVGSGAVRSEVDTGLVAMSVLELLGVWRVALMHGQLSADDATDQLLGLLLDGVRTPRR